MTSTHRTQYIAGATVGVAIGGLAKVASGMHGPPLGGWPANVAGCALAAFFGWRWVKAMARDRRSWARARARSLRSSEDCAWAGRDDEAQLAHELAWSRCYGDQPRNLVLVPRHLHDELHGPQRR